MRLGGECHINDEHKYNCKKSIEVIFKRNIDAFESKVDSDKNMHFKGIKCKASENSLQGMPPNSQKGSGGFSPANEDPADVSGSTDSHSRDSVFSNLLSGNFSPPEFSKLSAHFFQISRNTIVGA